MSSPEEFVASGGMKLSACSRVSQSAYIIRFRRQYDGLISFPGSIPSLNLVVLRLATVYGPYNLSGIVTPRITLGRVYKYLDEEMKYL